MGSVPKVETIPHILKQLPGAHPEIPAFIFWSPSGRRVLTRAEVFDLSSGFASRLTRQGIKPKDVVCVALPNSPERVVVECGIHLAGGVFMNGQILRADGVDFIETLNKAKCRLIVVCPNQTDGAWDVCQTFIREDPGNRDSLPVTDDRIKTVSTMLLCKSGTDTNSLIPSLKKGTTFMCTETDPTDTAAIYTTSGSSGYTKLVKYDHYSLIHMGRTLTLDYGSKEINKVFNAAPFGWLGGFVGNPLFTGGTRVLLDEFEDIPNKSVFTWNTVCAEDVQAVRLSPALLMDIYHQYSSGNVGKKIVQKIMTGGQPIKKEQLCCIIGTLTKTVAVGYGATEIGGIAGMVVDDHNIEDYTDCTAGHAMKGVDIKIVDEFLKPVPPDTRGEIFIHSATQSKGYVGDPTANNKFLSDGWFRTGDVGCFKSDGALVVEGRSSDAIMHGNYILYPTWLEQKLLSCPGVEQLVIVPVPHKDLHHEICICVVLKAGIHLTEEYILTFAKRQFKMRESSALSVVPRYVLFFDSFPSTKTGKLDRRELAQVAKFRLNL